MSPEHRIRRNDIRDEDQEEREPHPPADDEEIAGSNEPLMDGDDDRQEWWVLSRLDVPGLVQEPVALPLGERGAEHVVDRAVPAEIQGADRPPGPAGEDQRREDD